MQRIHLSNWYPELVCDRFRQGYFALSFLTMAANDQAHGRSFYRDDEIVVDRDGVPHFTGEKPELLAEYKKRVRLGIAQIRAEQEPPQDDWEEAAVAENRADLAKKLRRFRVRLLNGLHNKAWRRCEALDPQDVALPDGEFVIFEALQTLDKEAIIKKGVAFENFFEKSYRKRGTSVGDYIADKQRTWDELVELDPATQLSDDLQAYFLLKGANLSNDGAEERRIVLACGSTYATEPFHHAMKVNYHDIHLRESRGGGGGGGSSQACPAHPQARSQGRFVKKPPFRRGGRAALAGDEDEDGSEEAEANEAEEGSESDEAYAAQVASDAGGSECDSIYEATSPTTVHGKICATSRRREDSSLRALGLLTKFAATSGRSRSLLRRSALGVLLAAGSDTGLATRRARTRATRSSRRRATARAPRRSRTSLTRLSSRSTLTTASTRALPTSPLAATVRMMPLCSRTPLRLPRRG